MAPITSLILSPINVNHILTSSEDGTVKIWDLESQDMIDTIRVTDGKVAQMCVGQIGETWEVFATIICRVPKKNAKGKTSE